MLVIESAPAGAAATSAIQGLPAHGKCSSPGPAVLHCPPLPGNELVDHSRAIAFYALEGRCGRGVIVRTRGQEFGGKRDVESSSAFEGKRDDEFRRIRGRPSWSPMTTTTYSGTSVQARHAGFEVVTAVDGERRSGSR